MSHDLAEKILDKAEARAERATTLAVAWAFALLLLWLGALEPLVPRLRQLGATANQYQAKSRRAIELRTELAKAPTIPDERNARLSRLQTETDTARGEYSQAAEDARVAFAIPGVSEFKVPREKAGLVWCALFGALLAYLSRARGEVLELVDRAARLLRSRQNPGTIEDLRIPVRFPWWIAPLPVRLGGCQTADETHALVGWAARRSPSRWLVLIALAACVGLQIRVALIACASALVPISSRGRLPEASVVCALVSLTVVLTILIAGRWAFGSFAPSHPPNRPPSAPQSRRTFLVGASVGLALVSGATLLCARRWPGRFVSWLRHPRFRTARLWQARLPVTPGFVLNKKREVIHYAISGSGIGSPREQDGAPSSALMKVQQSRRSTPKAANFESIPLPLAMPTREAQPHVNRFARAGIIERAAEDLWNSNASDPLAKLEDRQRACGFLRCAVLQELQESGSRREDSGVIHRAYRLAKYLILLGDEAALGKFVEAIQASPLSSRFEVAIRSWTDANCRWRKRLRYVKV